MHDTPIPFKDVHVLVDKVLDQTEDQIAIIGGLKYITLLEHTATFAEHQFGKQIAGKVRYKRRNGDRIDA
jgi:hypothetical protein